MALLETGYRQPAKGSHRFTVGNIVDGHCIAFRRGDCYIRPKIYQSIKQASILLGLYKSLSAMVLGRVHSPHTLYFKSVATAITAQWICVLACSEVTEPARINGCAQTIRQFKYCLQSCSHEHDTALASFSVYSTPLPTRPPIVKEESSRKTG